MDTVKVAHIASFEGNIGDSLNHLGFRSWLETMLKPRAVVWVPFEIREVHRGSSQWRGRKTWDDFFSLLETCDLGVIGGGNFLELWVENSKTGTSLDFDLAQAQSAGKPILLNALGAYDGKGVCSTARERLPEFLQALNQSSQFLCTIRNDGSAQTLSQSLGVEAPRIIPDHGFFGAAEIQEAPSSNELPFIAINVAADMADSRFPSSWTFEDFTQELADSIQVISSQVNVNFRFVPHIYSDYEAINAVLRKLPDAILRHRVQVCGLEAAGPHAYAGFSSYLGAFLVLAMRFHATVFALARSIPVISLGNDKRTNAIMSEAGLVERVVPFGSGFFDSLIAKFALVSEGSATKDYLEHLHVLRADFEPVILDWLQDKSVIES